MSQCRAHRASRVAVLLDGDSEPVSLHESNLRRIPVEMDEELKYTSVCTYLSCMVAIAMLRSHSCAHVFTRVSNRLAAALPHVCDIHMHVHVARHRSNSQAKSLTWRSL